MWEARVHTSMHDEFPKRKIVRGTYLEKYFLNPVYFWLRVTLSNGVNRDILVTSPRLVGKSKAKFKRKKWERNKLPLKNPTAPLARMMVSGFRIKKVP